MSKETAIFLSSHIATRCQPLILLYAVDICLYQAYSWYLNMDFKKALTTLLLCSMWNMCFLTLNLLFWLWPINYFQAGNSYIISKIISRLYSYKNELSWKETNVVRVATTFLTYFVYMQHTSFLWYRGTTPFFPQMEIICNTRIYHPDYTWKVGHCCFPRQGRRHFS